MMDDEREMGITKSKRKKKCGVVESSRVKIRKIDLED